MKNYTDTELIDYLESGPHPLENIQELEWVYTHRNFKTIREALSRCIEVRKEWEGEECDDEKHKV
jgi:hypothetical protein